MRYLLQRQSMPISSSLMICLIRKPVISLEDYFQYLQYSKTILWLDLQEANLVAYL